MRRPVKPFVTEYKASNRRNPGAPGEQGVFESERPAAKPFDFMLRAEADDSYDSAMRAADALFSIQPEAKADVESAPQADGTSQPLFEASQPHSSQQEKAGGRILRVLDEELVPEYAAQEAEHAPKRRGRKPGSKNKPKDHSITAFSDAPEIFRTTRFAEAVDPIVSAPAVPAALKIPALTAAPVAPRALSHARILANGGGTNGAISDSTIRGDTRFPWVRDRLKPGEDWKRRRLPRICW